MNTVKRINPRRPIVSGSGNIPRIILGSNKGERGRHHATPASATKPLRSSAAFNATVLVFCHGDAGDLDQHSREVLASAALCAAPNEAVHLIVLGAYRHDLSVLAELGADVVEIHDSAAGKTWQADGWAQWLSQRCKSLKPRLTLAPDRGADADLGRRLAAMTGLPSACHVVELHAGMARIRLPNGEDGVCPLPPLLLLNRYVARGSLPFKGRGEQITAAAPDFSAFPAAAITTLGVDVGEAQSLPLEEADFILSAGNGVSDIPLFLQLAEALGAAVGASRVAVDEGRFPRSKQVGATGRTVRARGYVAIGISGAVQHLQGIKECRHVIAVNLDPAAPITQRAELTVVADAQALMQALLQAVKTARAAAPQGKSA